ncbi:MAG: hypothetical protein J6K84_01130 [Oscillospiraceae bacterium]|nr:hypothetical protein [Oscillospiraceae bacterium]
MEKPKKSGSALFMYAVIALTIAVSGVCFILYYGNIAPRGGVLWAGIVAFMILYHFWLRIIMGNVNKFFPIRKEHGWFQPRAFEKPLYRFLRVKRWKDKALTYNPEAFDLQKHSLEEVADTMAKSEFDHWVNEIISLVSILFSLLWGEFWIFLLTAIFAMLFDAQFIVIQRYNRPNVLRILEKQRQRALARA